MRRVSQWIVLLMVVSTTSVIAEILLDFKADPRFVNAKCLRVKGSLFLDFTIDHSGQVMLDASVDEANSKDVITTVNGWDGIIGYVTAPSLFDTSFSFAADAWRRNDEGRAYALSDLSISGDGSGYLGVVGQNWTLIDGASSPNRNHEMLVWTLTTSTVNLQVEVTSFIWDGMGDLLQRSILLFDNDTTNSWYDQPEAGGLNISDYVILNEEPITFSIPEDGSVGYGLSGFAFEIVSLSDAASFSSKMASGKPAALGLLVY